MRENVETSPLLKYRAETVVPGRILQMEEAIRNCDFASFAKLTCADSNQFQAVCLDNSLSIFYMNDTSHRIISFVERWNKSEGTPQVVYTFDAGPNAVLILPNRKTAQLLLQRLLFFFPPSETELSKFERSFTTVEDVESMEDVESLQPPSDLRDNYPQEKLRGNISYFICTKLGNGPSLLVNEDLALIDPKTGFPK